MWTHFFAAGTEIRTRTNSRHADFTCATTRHFRQEDAGHPKPYTLNPKPDALNPKLVTIKPKPEILDPKISTPNPKP